MINKDVMNEAKNILEKLEFHDYDYSDGQLPIIVLQKQINEIQEDIKTIKECIESLKNTDESLIKAFDNLGKIALIRGIDK